MKTIQGQSQVRKSEGTSNSHETTTSRLSSNVDEILTKTTKEDNKNSSQARYKANLESIYLLDQPNQHGSKKLKDNQDNQKETLPLKRDNGSSVSRVNGRGKRSLSSPSRISRYHKNCSSSLPTNSSCKNLSHPSKIKNGYKNPLRSTSVNGIHRSPSSTASSGHSNPINDTTKKCNGHCKEKMDPSCTDLSDQLHDKETDQKMTEYTQQEIHDSKGMNSSLEIRKAAHRHNCQACQKDWTTEALASSWPAESDLWRRSNSYDGDDGSSPGYTYYYYQPSKFGSHLVRQQICPPSIRVKTPSKINEKQNRHSTNQGKEVLQCQDTKKSKLPQKLQHRPMSAICLPSYQNYSNSPISLLSQTNASKNSYQEKCSLVFSKARNDSPNRAVSSSLTMDEQRHKDKNQFNAVKFKAFIAGNRMHLNDTILAKNLAKLKVPTGGCPPRKAQNKMVLCDLLTCNK